MKIYVTRPIPETGINLLKQKGFEVVVNPENRVLSKDELKTAVAGFDAILCLLTDKIDGEVFDAAGRQLKIVANYAVGFDNINLADAKSRNIMVTNTPGVLTQAVAEHTWALIFAVARKIVTSDKFTRAGEYKQWEPLGFLGPQLEGATLGVVGLGRIGSKVAEIGRNGLNMNIIYNDVKPNADFEKELSAKYCQIDELLTQADIVSIHVPLLPETTHLINAERLSSMKKTSILVNTSRGPIIDEAALVEALKNKTIWGAGLDVFEHEPNLAPGLTELENVVLSPHTASATIFARDEMSRLAAENIISALTGQKPANLVE